MDPNETFKLVTDESLPLSERAEAAVDLLVWLANAGALPHYTTAVSIATFHVYVVDQCKTVLAKVLDALDADPIEAVLNQIRED